MALQQQEVVRQQEAVWPLSSAALRKFNNRPP